MEYSREEIEKMIEKAKADLEATLAKMTPEERAEAEARAKKMIEEDNARTQKLIEDAAKLTSRAPSPKFCSNCGAKVEGGNFCEYCGSPLNK